MYLVITKMKSPSLTLTQKSGCLKFLSFQDLSKEKNLDKFKLGYSSYTAEDVCKTTG